MLATEERPMTGGAGWMPRERIAADEKDVVNVLVQNYRSDRDGNEQIDWAAKLVEQDLFADMESELVAMALESIMMDTQAHTKPVRDRIVFLIREELKL